MSARRGVRSCENKKSNAKIPTILNRKRKSDEDHSQPDIQNYFNVMAPSKSCENLRVTPLSSIQNRPASSRVPLAPLSLGSENINPEDSLHQASHHQSQVDCNTPKSRKLNWKKPRMRESWSQFRAFINEPVKSGIRGESRLPELNFADRQELWDLMAKKDTGMYSRQSADSILARHPALQPKMRAILLEWLSEVCETYRLHRETFYLSIDFLDRFLGVASNIPKNKLQLIGVTCLFIGAKLEEIYPPKLQEFAYVTDGACTEQQILQMELVILKSLNWGLSPMTPNSWMRLYMQILHGPRKDTGTSFVLPAFSGLPYTSVMQLLDLCMLDIGSLNYTYSVLATSALYHAESETVALGVSGFTWPEVAPCVRWMAAFAQSIRERSPLQPKTFHGISSDDAHHIQTHSVDLALLERSMARLNALAAASASAMRHSPDPGHHPMMLSTGGLMPGLDQTPPEEEGDIMYPPSSSSATATNLGAGFYAGGGLSVHQFQAQQQQLPNSVMLSPGVDSDI